jgi:hypothetical protein
MQLIAGLVDTWAGISSAILHSWIYHHYTWSHALWANRASLNVVRFR